jgi:hypothetical protein
MVYERLRRREVLGTNDLSESFRQTHKKVVIMVVERDWKVAISSPALDSDRNDVHVLQWEYELNDYTAKVLMDSFDSVDSPGGYKVVFYYPRRDDYGVMTYVIYETFYRSEERAESLHSLLSLLCDDLPNAKLLYTSQGW